jgi:hypothetical protein
MKLGNIILIVVAAFVIGVGVAVGAGAAGKWHARCRKRILLPGEYQLIYLLNILANSTRLSEMWIILLVSFQVKRIMSQMCIYKHLQYQINAPSKHVS